VSSRRAKCPIKTSNEVGPYKFFLVYVELFGTQSRVRFQKSTTMRTLAFADFRSCSPGSVTFHCCGVVHQPGKFKPLKLRVPHAYDCILSEAGKRQRKGPG